MSIEYQTAVENDKGVIVVEGDLDNEHAGEALRKAFNNLCGQDLKTVVLDLRNVQIINSYGIGKILTCYKEIKSNGGVMMVKPLRGFVKETFELLMLDRLFPVDEEPDNAPAD